MIVEGSARTRSLTEAGCEANGLKRDALARASRSGNSERRREGGGTLVGGGPPGSRSASGAVDGAADVAVAGTEGAKPGSLGSFPSHASQSQSDEAVAVGLDLGFRSAPFAASALDLAGAWELDGAGGRSSKSPQLSSKLLSGSFFSSSYVGQAVTGDGESPVTSGGNSDAFGVATPRPGKGFRSWKEGETGAWG